MILNIYKKVKIDVVLMNDWLRNTNPCIRLYVGTFTLKGEKIIENFIPGPHRYQYYTLIKLLLLNLFSCYFLGLRKYTIWNNRNINYFYFIYAIGNVINHNRVLYWLGLMQNTHLPSQYQQCWVPQNNCFDEDFIKFVILNSYFLC